MNWKRPEHRASEPGKTFKRFAGCSRTRQGWSCQQQAERRLILRVDFKDGVRKALKDRQNALTDLVHAIREYRKLADQKLQGSDYAHAVQELNKAIDRAEAFL
jgi:hypothetical protein